MTRDTPIDSLYKVIYPQRRLGVHLLKSCLFVVVQVFRNFSSMFKYHLTPRSKIFGLKPLPLNEELDIIDVIVNMIAVLYFE